MILRHKLQIVRDRLSQFPAVALLGPRQVGKTTLAEHIGEKQPSIYLDLEHPSDREKLSDADLYLSSHEDKLVILDEVHRMPELFPDTSPASLTGGVVATSGRGRFLLLGSASVELLKQSGESLAGRIAYIELEPFSVPEINGEEHEKLWIRGGFPDSFLTQNDRDSVVWPRELYPHLSGT